MHVSYTEARNNLSTLLNQVCTEHQPLLIERQEGQNAVVVSEADWNALQETLLLMSNPKDWKAIAEPVDPKECSETLSWE